MSHTAGQSVKDEVESGVQSPRGGRPVTFLERLLAGTRRRPVLYWACFGFLLRIFLASYFEQVITPDGVHYVTLGRALAAGNFHDGLSTYWPPLYPLLIGSSSLVFRDPEFAGRLVSVVAGSLLVIPSYRLIREWYGERAALVGAGLVALHPLLVYYSTLVLTESTYTLLFTCGILAGWSSLSTGRARSFLLTGLIFGACYLLKPEAAGLLLLLVVWALLARRLSNERGSIKTAARNALLVCAGFLLLAAPYLFYLKHETGSWTLSGKAAAHLWQGNRMAGSWDAPGEMPVVPGAGTALVQLTKALRGEYEIFNLIFPPTYVLLVGLALFRERWAGGRWRRELYLFSFVAAALVGYAVTLPNIRFFIPLLPILLCWTAKGVVELAGWATETAAKSDRARKLLPGARKAIVPLTIAVLLLSLAPLSAYLWGGDKWSDYRGQKRAALWIKEQASAETPVVMATVPVAAYYAGGRYVELRDEDYAALVARARREGAGYLVVNERDFKYMRLSPLLDEGGTHPGLHLAHTLSEGPGHKILVYAVEDAEQSPRAEEP